MKNIFTTIILLLISVASYAQKDVTQFLGIPVDGSKSEMIQKLKDKGYTISPHNKDVLTGQFNGADVNIHIATNNNKVCRIMVCDANSTNEGSIRIRFNKLCQQFNNNPRYMPASLSSSDYILSDSEKISYEMTVNKKRYDAAFYQKPAIADSLAMVNEIQSIILTKYTEEQLSAPTEELKNEIITTTIAYMMDKYSKKLVWFMISDDSYGKYYITMFYDNEYNRASGEDL